MFRMHPRARRSVRPQSCWRAFEGTYRFFARSAPPGPRVRPSAECVKLIACPDQTSPAIIYGVSLKGCQHLEQCNAILQVHRRFMKHAPRAVASPFLYFEREYLTIDFSALLHPYCDPLSVDIAVRSGCSRCLLHRRSITRAVSFQYEPRKSLQADASCSKGPSSSRLHGHNADVSDYRPNSSALQVVQLIAHPLALAAWQRIAAWVRGPHHSGTGGDKGESSSESTAIT